MTCHDEHSIPVATGLRRFVLVGSLSCGRTALFNALTGLRTRTDSYPGVTVSRYEGVHKLGDVEAITEDLPDTYSFGPISPDEEVVMEALDVGESVHSPISGHVALMDAAQLRRGFGMLAQVQQHERPIVAVLIFTDELAQRGGSADVDALSRAVGVQVIPVTSGDKRGTGVLSKTFAGVDSWSAPIVPPPTSHEEVATWADSVLESASYRAPDVNERAHRIDKVLLHPLWGTLVFFVTMYAFFQTIFTAAAPINGAFGGFFVWMGGIAKDVAPIDWLGSLVSSGIFAGVDAVVAFVPRVALLFLMIALLKGSGYLPRAAFLMDRAMGMAGLEGRTFIALLSSIACAIPGIMATRTLPSARDRIATMIGAPLTVCSAHLPVYTLMIGIMVSGDLFWGSFQAQGTIMFGLYLPGAVPTMIATWAFKRIIGRGAAQLSFYMEMPSYRLPSARSIIIAVWDACKALLRKVAGIIMVITVVPQGLLNLPTPGEDVMTAAGVDVGDEATMTAYTLDNSYAAAIGRAVLPVFGPLGFDWRINIGVISSLAARETIVSTLGQVASAEDSEDPGESLEGMTHSDDPHAGESVFTPNTVVALLVFFAYALQCASTLGMMRCETGMRRWSIIVFICMSGLAQAMTFAAKPIVGAIAI